MTGTTPADTVRAADGVAVALAPEMDLAGIVTHEYPLERHVDAFGDPGCAVGENAASPTYRAMKVVIRSAPGAPGADGWPDR